MVNYLSTWPDVEASKRQGSLVLPMAVWRPTGTVGSLIPWAEETQLRPPAFIFLFPDCLDPLPRGQHRPWVRMSLSFELLLSCILSQRQEKELRPIWTPGHWGITWDFPYPTPALPQPTPARVREMEEETAVASLGVCSSHQWGMSPKMGHACWLGLLKQPSGWLAFSS